MSGVDLYAYDRVADRIRLHRQVDASPVIIGEGDADRRFVNRVVPERYDFFIAGTRDRVLEAGRQVVRLGIDRVACVVDRDFDGSVAAAESEALPIAAYDNADLEAMLWGTSVLDDVIQEVGSRQKVNAFGGTAAVKQAAVEAVLPLQRLRRANAVHGWGLRFDSLDLRRKISMTTLDIRIESLCDALWNADLGVHKSRLYEAAASYPEAICPVTGQQLVRGRDALASLGVLMRRAVGNLKFHEAHSDRLSEAVRLRATESTLASTQWLHRLRRHLEIRE